MNFLTFLQFGYLFSNAKTGCAFDGNSYTGFWILTPRCSIYYLFISFSLAVSAFYKLSRWAYSSTLKTETIYFSEASVDYQRTTRRFILEIELFMKVSVHCMPSVPNKEKYNLQTANSVFSAYINISLYNNKNPVWFCINTYHGN